MRYIFVLSISAFQPLVSSSFVGSSFLRHCPPNDVDILRPGSLLAVLVKPHVSNVSGRHATIDGVALMMSSPSKLNEDQDEKELIESLLSELADAAVKKDRAKAFKIFREIQKSEAYDKEAKEMVGSLFETVPPPLPQPVAVWNDIERAGKIALKKVESFQGLSDAHGFLPVPEEETKEAFEEPGKYELKQVWFATNRDHKDGDFGNSCTGGTIYGKVYVKVPIFHLIGEMNRNWFQRNIADPISGGILSVRDWVMPTKSMITRTEVYLEGKKKSFFNDVTESQNEASDIDMNENNALLYIHGFFNGFEDAAQAAAQLGTDLKVKGPKAFFSWPSQNAFSSYFEDEEMVKASHQQVKEFVLEFAKACGSKNMKLNIIAHSMGNRALLNALEDIFNDSSIDGVKLGQVIFAAPDVDHIKFKQQAHQIVEAPIRRKTLYTCHGDKALWGSGVLHGQPRAGKYYPYTKAQGVDTIAVPAYLKMDFFGHGYYKDAKEMVTDMHALIHFDQPPEERVMLVKALNKEGKIANGVRSVKR